MKKLMVVMLVLSCLMVPSISFSKGYLVAGVGSGGDAGTGWKIEGGGFGTEENKNNVLYGFGFMMTTNRDQMPSGTVKDYPYPLPHNIYYYNNGRYYLDYKDIGNLKKGEEYGFYGKLGFEPIKSSGLFAFGTLGFSMGEEAHVSQTQCGLGWYYIESKETKFYGVYGGGLAFNPKGSNLMFQAEWQSRIGFMGSIGIAW